MYLNVIGNNLNVDLNSKATNFKTQFKIKYVALQRFK